MEFVKKIKSSNISQALILRLRNHLYCHFPNGGRICVAVSGGMDSCALLHATTHLSNDWEISVCHVNHGISPRCDKWEYFCYRCCQQYGFQFYVHREKPIKGNVSEDWARSVRLRAFKTISADAIIAAHHADDQAETVLFRLLRGSGVHGMASMREKTVLAGKIILRPWLNVNREQIRRYAYDNRLSWVEDEDNRNLYRRRNFLRWQGIVTLSEQFPDCISSLAATGRRIQEGSNLLADLAKIDNQQARQDCGGWNINYFRGVGGARMRNWLYFSLQERQQRFSERHIAELARQVMANPFSKVLQIHCQGWILRVWRHVVYWENSSSYPPFNDYEIPVKAVESIFPVDVVGGRLVLARTQGSGLSLAKTGSKLLLKPRVGGERLKRRGGPYRVSQLLQQSQVFPWRRGRMPLIFVGSQLVAIPGIAVAEEFAAQENELGLSCQFEWNNYSLSMSDSTMRIPADVAKRVKLGKEV